MHPSTVGLDVAKHAFEVHGVDAPEQVMVWKKPRRIELLAFFEVLPPCLVGMEVCGTAHHWARELCGERACLIVLETK